MVSISNNLLLVCIYYLSIKKSKCFKRHVEIKYNNKKSICTEKFRKDISPTHKQTTQYLS